MLINADIADDDDFEIDVVAMIIDGHWAYATTAFPKIIEIIRDIDISTL